LTNSEMLEPTLEQAYVLDTHTLIWHLTQSKQLSQSARAIFAAALRGETQLIVPAIALAEMFYANQKWHWFDNFKETYTELKAQAHFTFVPFQPDDVLDLAHDMRIPEMHDRIIAGLARRLNVPLITSDPLITAAEVVRVVW